MEYVRICIILILSSFTLKAFSFEDTGGFYRDEVFSGVQSNNCGSLCIANPGYYQGYLNQQERNSRLFSPETIYSRHARQEEELNALNYRKFKSKDRVQGLGWGPDTKVSKMIMTKKIRVARALRDMGFQVEENDKSLGSALWREIRKPFLFGIRDRIAAPYKKKKLSLSEKARVWFLEQTVDAGASSLDLDSFGGSEGQSFNTNFDIKDFIVKFYPRVDPVRGRYGVRFKARQYLRRSKPLYMAFNLNYCNSSTGLGDKVCRYQHELSTSFSFQDLSRKWACSAYVSYQTDSLDVDAYVVNGEPYEHKPWVAGLNLTYAFN